MTYKSSVARRLKALEKSIGADVAERSPILIYDAATGLPADTGGAFIAIPHNGREPIDSETR